jgi:hypothetical protein
MKCYHLFEYAMPSSRKPCMWKRPGVLDRWVGKMPAYAIGLFRNVLSLLLTIWWSSDCAVM